MKTKRQRFGEVLIWAGGLFTVGSTILFLFNLDSYWIPAGVGCIFILAVIIYFVSAGFNDV